MSGFRNFRAGIEVWISFLKRCLGLERCSWRGEDAFSRYAGASIVANGASCGGAGGRVGREGAHGCDSDGDEHSRAERLVASLRRRAGPIAPAWRCREGLRLSPVERLHEAGEAGSLAISGVAWSRSERM